MIRRLASKLNFRKAARLARQHEKALLGMLEMMVGDEDDWKAVAPLINRLISGRDPHEITEQLVRLFRYVTKFNTPAEKRILANCVRQASHRMRPKGKSK